MIDLILNKEILCQVQSNARLLSPQLNLAFLFFPPFSNPSYIVLFVKKHIKKNISQEYAFVKQKTALLAILPRHKMPVPQNNKTLQINVGFY
ncbi:MAG: hypothetical protein L6275_03975 [Candidatus Portnoybacteria bacterium]|nr:hypothetical protein [Candidatus Portnoybacteria bacterium]